MIRSGVASGDITPEPGPVLQGHWNTNPSHSVLYPLEVRAVVFADGDTQIAIATLDVIGITRATTDRIRATSGKYHSKRQRNGSVQPHTLRPPHIAVFGHDPRPRIYGSHSRNHRRVHSRSRRKSPARNSWPGMWIRAF